MGRRLALAGAAVALVLGVAGWGVAGWGVVGWGVAGWGVAGWGVAGWRAVGWRAVQPAPDAGWQEIAWPFPRDAWATGLAFQCRSVSCGGALRVFVRPKRGFCANCATGVTGDAEVDGVADLDMVATDYVATGPGEPAAYGQLEGRRRSYRVRLPGDRRSMGMGIALTRHGQCDLVVVAAEGTDPDAGRIAIEGLLASHRVTSWIDRQLDGR